MPPQRCFSEFACCQAAQRVEDGRGTASVVSLDQRGAQRNRDSSGLRQINGWAMIRLRK
jgi:hypothetical protein